MRFPRESYIPKHATKVADKQSDALCYFAPFHHRPSGNTYFHLVGFAGKADKPIINFTIRNQQQLERTIAEFFANRKAHADLVSKRREERKAFVHNVKVGDIYHTSWGYDQTNVEFFEVVEIKGKFAVLREIGCAREGGGPAGYRVVPQSGQYLPMRHAEDEDRKPLRRLIQEHGIKIDDVRTAWPWGKRDPITGTVLGRSLYETDSLFGH